MPLIQGTFQHRTIELRARLPCTVILILVILSGARSAESKDLLSFGVPQQHEGKQVLRLHSAALRSAQDDGVKMAQASTMPAVQATPPQQDSQPQTVPPPKGKVLFVRAPRCTGTKSNLLQRMRVLRRHQRKRRLPLSTRFRAARLKMMEEHQDRSLSPQRTGKPQAASPTWSEAPLLSPPPISTST